MTKTLTEQWREGRLEYGYYYVKHTFGWKPFGITIDFWHGPFDKWGAIPNDYVQEVLAAVPGYDEFLALSYFKIIEEDAIQKLIKENNRELIKKTDKLEKKLAIAAKALEDLETKSDKFDDSWGVQEQLDFIKGKCQETLYHLKEKEGVK